MKKTLVIILCLISAIGYLFYSSYLSYEDRHNGNSENANEETEKADPKFYLCGNTPFIEAVLNIETMEKIEIPRGREVKRIGEPIDVQTDLSAKYYEIEYNDKENLKKTVFVKSDILSSLEQDIVKEKEMFVRTSTHIYSDDKKKIGAIIEKGTKLEVIGYDEINPDTGVSKWYKVKNVEKNVEGFVRGKYLLDNEELAKAEFNENNIMSIHKERGNKWGAGAAEKLDYYPREKGSFENNKMPDEVNALYINSSAIKNAESFIEVAKGTRINAFVVDIKDNTTPAFPAEAMKEYSPSNYKSAQKYFSTEKEFGDNVKKLKDAGFYVIGRITVFKDSNYIKDHPEHAIVDKNTNKPLLHDNTYWPSAYQRDVWTFNVELAKEAVKKFGFNEIQFDYIRFPDRTQKFEKNNQIDFKNTYNETKSQALQRFLMFAVDELHDLDVYVAGDVFGEAANNYVTPYGQYWNSISNVVDVISPMAYPDHFWYGDYGFDYPWLYPYELLTLWSKMANDRQKESPTPAKIRPWIQSHNSMFKPKKPYGAKEVSQQVSAYYDSGIKNGFMTWWSISSISGYKSEVEAYKKEY